MKPAELFPESEKAVKKLDEAMDKALDTMIKTMDANTGPQQREAASAVISLWVGVKSMQWQTNIGAQNFVLGFGGRANSEPN